MVTSIGAFLRKIRISNEEILRDMAEKLGVTSAFLSAVENGKKKMPTKWVSTLQELYHLDSDQMAEMQKAILESSDIVELNIKNTSSTNRELAISFARQFDTMDEETSNELLKFLKNRKKGG